MCFIIYNYIVTHVLNFFIVLKGKKKKNSMITAKKTKLTNLTKGRKIRNE